MTPTQWQALQQVFEQALALPLIERQLYLENHYQGNTELINEVTRMIAQTENDGHLLTELVEQSVEQVINSEELIGKRLGAFELTQRIGVGGMGEVYQAKRVDGEFEQQVAVKIIRLGYLNEHINLRFQTERQILAQLNHPNIARVIDGGRFDGERLYLAMEYVEGIPIDVYCRQKGLNKEQKLTLFLKVCTAVSSAHQNRIIHCDIKPTNILVSEDGEPHLLDFGIATFIDADTNSKESNTDSNSINAITWDYASPEQQANKNLTTATDIYALGILLYELLVGERPSINQQKSIKQQLADLANIDLQMIIAKTLQREPSKRYSSLDKLADDIQCLSTKSPISLRITERKYLFTRFIQRNKTVATLTCVTILLLLGFSYREHQLRTYAELAQVKAQQESEKSRQVISFLTNIFKISDPNQAKGSSVTAREILDKGRNKISKDLQNQPAVHHELLLTIANVYENLGLYKDAKKVYLQGIALVTVEFPSNLSLSLNMLNKLAFVNIQLSLLPEAEQVLQQALRYDLPQHHPEFASSYNYLGLLRHEQDKQTAAITHFQTALQIKNQSDGINTVGYLRIQHNLASSYMETGQYKKAEELLLQILKAKELIYGKQHQSYIRSLSSYVNLAQYQGIQEHTLPLALEIVSLAQAVLDESHPDLSNGLNTLAHVLHEKGDFKQAKKHYIQLLELDRKYSGESSISYSVSLNGLASLNMDMQDYTSAEPLFRQSLQIRRSLYEDSHSRVATVLGKLGELLNLTGRFDEALTVSQQALAILQSKENQSSYSISTTQITLAQSYLGNKNWQKSALILEQVKLRLTADFKPQHKLFAQLYFAQAKLEAAQGNIKNAITLIKKSLAIDTNRLDAQHPLLAKYRVQMAEWLITQKQWQQAKQLIEQSITSVNQYLYPNAPTRLKAYSILKQIDTELALIVSPHQTVTLSVK